jgi:TPR repeat protein
MFVEVGRSFDYTARIRERRQMSDVFISYKREDEQRVAAIHRALEHAGLSVWWDREIAGGDKWRQRIEEQLQIAACVLVVWSKHSTTTAGEFVVDEANHAKRRGVLVQVKIDEVSLPLGFGEQQAIDLAWWSGDNEDIRLQDLIAAVKTRVERGPLCAPDEIPEVLQLRKLAEAGDGQSMARLGLMYENGKGGLEKDFAQAVRWYRMAVETGNRRGMAYLGIMYENGLGGLREDKEEAAKLYRRASELGDARGMAYLGAMYEGGLGGLREDKEEAVKLYRKASELGDSRGMAYLATMYEHGLGGLAPSVKCAMEWYLRAAELGELRAMVRLAVLFESGRADLRADPAQALYWFHKAAKADHTGSMVCLGLMYAEGMPGLAKDDAQAVLWFREAARLGERRGMTYLGVMFASGRGGLPKDGRHAVVWYHKAAAVGDGRGMSYLGLMHEQGLGGLTTDEAHAAELYLKAAEAGNWYAAIRLSYMYAEGRGGLTKSRAKASHWFLQGTRDKSYAGTLFRRISFFRIPHRREIAATSKVLLALIILFLLSTPFTDSLYGWEISNWLSNAMVFAFAIVPLIAGYGTYFLLFRKLSSMKWDSRVLYAAAALWVLTISILEMTIPGQVILAFGMGFAFGWVWWKIEDSRPIGGESVGLW